MAIAIYDGFDLPVEFLKTSGAQIPYKFEIYLLLGMLILVANLRRSIRRWMGAWMLHKQDRFLFNSVVSTKRKKRVITYLFLESFVMLFIAYALYRLTPDAWMPITGYLFGAFDGVVFALVGAMSKIFRVAISSKAVISADREVNLVYFEGLRRLSIQQQSVFFDYIKGLQLTFPSDVVTEIKKEDFKQTLLAQIDQEQVFVEENFKTY